MQYIVPKTFISGAILNAARYPEWAAEGREAIMWLYEWDGPRILDRYYVWKLSPEGFIVGQSERERDGRALCREFYVRMYDLESIGRDNYLYALPRRG